MAISFLFFKFWLPNVFLKMPPVDLVAEYCKYGTLYILICSVYQIRTDKWIIDTFYIKNRFAITLTTFFLFWYCTCFSLSYLISGHMYGFAGNDFLYVTRSSECIPVNSVVVTVIKYMYICWVLFCLRYVTQHDKHWSFFSSLPTIKCVFSGYIKF